MGQATSSRGQDGDRTYRKGPAIIDIHVTRLWKVTHGISGACVRF